MSSKVTSTRIGKARLRTSVYINPSLIDGPDTVAQTATLTFFSNEARAEFDLTLNATDTEALIASLQQHLKFIEQAQAELATSTQQQAA